MKNEIILYRPDDHAEHIEVWIDENTETIWLTQQQIADLFGTQRPAITKHLANNALLSYTLVLAPASSTT